jgi:Flp pilus assembly CpaE family ATPase
MVVDVARIVLALEEHDVAEQVMHFLDRSGRARVVATAGDDRQLAEAVRQLEPDAVVAQPALLAAGSPLGMAVIALDTRESVAGLRTAIRAGARAFFVWPADREELALATAGTAASPDTGRARGRTIAVYAPRGAGATFVATHLAAAVARRKLDCVLVDADPVFADVTAALGAHITDGPAPRTIADLLPLLDELDAAALAEATWSHPDGFRVLLAPETVDATRVGPAALRRVLDASAEAADVVVAQLPRSLDGLAVAGIEEADRVVFVLTLDALSFRAAKRACELLPGVEVDFVVNRASRAEVTPGDVVRVFGREPVGVLPFDRAVGRAQDHGRLLPARGRPGRAFDRLAARLLGDLPKNEDLPAATPERDSAVR